MIYSYSQKRRSPGWRLEDPFRGSSAQTRKRIPKALASENDPPGGIKPAVWRRSQTTAQSWRPRTRSLSPGSAAAAASSRSAGCPPWWGAVAALAHRVGRPRVVHLVKALHGLVLVVLAALQLQQVMHGHGAAVVVNVVAALAAWIVWMKQAGFGVAGASGLVASVFLTLKAILIDSGSMNEVPLVRGMRQTLEVAGEKELSELGKYCTAIRLGGRTRLRSGGAGSGRPAPLRALPLLRPRGPLLPALRALRRRPVMEGQRVGLWVSSKVVLAEAVSSALAHRPWPWRECGSLPQESPSRGVCCRGCGLGSLLDCTKSSK